jgi:hypothetical protein
MEKWRSISSKISGGRCGLVFLFSYRAYGVGCENFFIFDFFGRFATMADTHNPFPASWL